MGHGLPYDHQDIDVTVRAEAAEGGGAVEVDAGAYSALPALRGGSCRVMRSNSSFSGSPTSRPNSVSP